MKAIRILAINPGSTSTKIAVYQDTEPIFLKNIKHTPEDLAPFHKIADQFHFGKTSFFSSFMMRISPLSRFMPLWAAEVY